MIRKEKDYFILDTDHTTYCFRVLPTGQLEHLYYGESFISRTKRYAAAGGKACLCTG